VSDLTAWTVWAVKNKQSGLADLLAQVADELDAERALADDLHDFIARYPETPWSDQLRQQWIAERSDLLARWREARQR